MGKNHQLPASLGYQHSLCLLEGCAVPRALATCHQRPPSRPGLAPTLASWAEAQVLPSPACHKTTLLSPVHPPRFLGARFSPNGPSEVVQWLSGGTRPLPGKAQGRPEHFQAAWGLAASLQ